MLQAACRAVCMCFHELSCDHSCLRMCGRRIDSAAGGAHRHMRIGLLTTALVEEMSSALRTPLFTENSAACGLQSIASLPLAQLLITRFEADVGLRAVAGSNGRSRSLDNKAAIPGGCVMENVRQAAGGGLCRQALAAAVLRGFHVSLPCSCWRSNPSWQPTLATGTTGTAYIMQQVSCCLVSHCPTHARPLKGAQVVLINGLDCWHASPAGKHLTNAALRLPCSQWAYQGAGGSH